MTDGPGASGPQPGYGLNHLPYGAVVDGSGRRYAAVRFGDAVLDLAEIDADLFGEGSLDRFLAAGPVVWAQVRAAVADRLAADRSPLVPLTDVTEVLGFSPADYVDFYASRDHATNAGRIFRPDGEPLPANWLHLPVGYHGRAGSLVPSGTDVRRPVGLLGPAEYGPSRRLDFEAEVAFVVGVPGERIATDRADEHVFGVCLLNDWSARDIQRFETVPLGPFLGKSFATSIATWITPLAALADARVPATAQEPPPVGHLREDGRTALDLTLRVSINGSDVSRPRFAEIYWSYAQLLAHLTSNGAAVRTGDVFASGTVSGPRRDQEGCLLELTRNGAEPLLLADGSIRDWLADGDEVVVTASAGRSEAALTLAPVRGRVVAG